MAAMVGETTIELMSRMFEFVKRSAVKTRPGPKMSEPESGRLELKIVSDPANLREVRHRIEQFAEAAGLSRQACDDLGLVANEALANIIRHGYGGAKDRPILVTAEKEGTAVRLSIRDWAKPFDPQSLPREKSDPLKPGGLGLVCMRKLMDDVQFVRLSDGMQLTMIKRSK
jgi:anti-sigma regulatory factor (Ser/Thr protein kinase)